MSSRTTPDLERRGNLPRRLHRRHLGSPGCGAGFAWHLEDVIVEGDRVSTRLRDTGTPVKEWLGLQPTGASAEFTEFCV